MAALLKSALFINELTPVKCTAVAVHARRYCLRPKLARWPLSADLESMQHALASLHRR